MRGEDTEGGEGDKGVERVERERGGKTRERERERNRDRHGQTDRQAGRVDRKRQPIATRSQGRRSPVEQLNQLYFGTSGTESKSSPRTCA